jgi:hypothetical protein
MDDTVPAGGGIVQGALAHMLNLHVAQTHLARSTELPI